MISEKTTRAICIRTYEADPKHGKVFVKNEVYSCEKNQHGTMIRLNKYYNIVFSVVSLNNHFDDYEDWIIKNRKKKLNKI